MADRTVPAASSAAPPAAPAGGASTAPHKQALFDAAVEVMQKQREERAAARAAEDARRRDQSRVSPIIAAGLTLILAVGVYVGVEQPTWLFPPAPPVESQETREASLRIGMATTMQRIERFRLAQGRLPRTLAEAGASPSGITYEQREGDHYTLRGTNGSVRLTLKSEDSLPLFVGNSFRVLALRSHR
jgi:hypothetical protein